MSTASEMSMEHYERPEVRAAILALCEYGGGLRGLNGGDGWYVHKGDLIRLRGPADFDDTISKERSLYMTADIFDPAVFDIWERRIEERGEVKPENTIGTRADLISYSLFADIDAVQDPNDEGDEDGKPRSKLYHKGRIEALEAAASFMVRYLKDRGISEAVGVLFSGQGIYVWLFPELSDMSEVRALPDFDPDELDVAFKIWFVAFNDLLADIEAAFFEEFPEHKGRVKFDKLNHIKRKVKCLLSIHKTLPFVVVPLDRGDIKIDLEAARIGDHGLPAETIERAKVWLSTWKAGEGERSALVKLLEPYRQKAAEDVTAKAKTSGEIQRSSEPIPVESWCPFYRALLEFPGGAGAHRVCGALATWLYQAGWSEEEAFQLWGPVAARCDVETRIFFTSFGVINSPNCETIKRRGTGYPALSFGELDLCRPDETCAGCHWPGDYGEGFPTGDGDCGGFHLGDFGTWETVHKRGPINKETGKSTLIPVQAFTFSPEKAAKAIIERYDIVSTPDEAILVYEDGIFKPEGEFLIEKILATTAGDHASIRQRREVLARIVLMTRAEYDELDSQPYLFPVENGIIDLRRGLDGFMPHDPKYRRTWKSPVTFDLSATCPEIEKYLASSLDEGGRNTYIDILAAKLSAYNFPFFSPWVGRGRNGKRMGTEIMRGIVGDSLITEVEIHKFHERRFDQIEIRGKHFIINNEVPRTATKGFDWIKKISGGDPITADEKGKPQKQFRPHALIIFDCNNPPKIDDYTKAIEERIAPIWWNVSFVDDPDPNDTREKKRDPHLEEKITDPAELSGFLNVLLQEAPRLIKTRAIRRAATGAVLVEMYDFKANHLAIFWDRFMIYQSGAAASSTRAHEKYGDLCRAVQVSPITLTGFNAYGQRRGFRKGRPYVTSDDGKMVRMNGWFDCLLDEEELEALLESLNDDGMTTDRQRGMDGTGDGTGEPEKNQHPGMKRTDNPLSSPILEIERIEKDDDNRCIIRSGKENPSHPFFPSPVVDSTPPILKKPIPSGNKPIPSVDGGHVPIVEELVEGDWREAEKSQTPEPKGYDDLAPTAEEAEVLAEMSSAILVNWPGLPELMLWERARDRLGHPISIATVRFWLAEEGYILSSERLNGSPLWNPPVGAVG